MGCIDTFFFLVDWQVDQYCSLTKGSEDVYEVADALVLAQNCDDIGDGNDNKEERVFQSWAFAFMFILQGYTLIPASVVTVFIIYGPCTHEPFPRHLIKQMKPLSRLQKIMTIWKYNCCKGQNIWKILNTDTEIWKITFQLRITNARREINFMRRLVFFFLSSLYFWRFRVQYCIN